MESNRVNSQGLLRQNFYPYSLLSIDISSAVILGLALVLTGCRSSKKQSAQAVMTELYNTLSVTLTAQAGAFTPTPSDTATPTVSPTLEPSPTEEATQTAQPAEPAVSSSSSSTCDDSSYVSDVTIPDGIVVAPGLSFEKTWMFLNSGSCSWTKKYYISFISGDDMDGSDTSIDQSVSSASAATSTRTSTPTRTPTSSTVIKNTSTPTTVSQLSATSTPLPTDTPIVESESSATPYP